MVKKEIPTLTASDYLGSGAYKNCYRLNKNEVALISFYGSITTDYNRLVKLKKLKVPVPAFRLEKIKVDGIYKCKAEHNQSLWNLADFVRRHSKRLKFKTKIPKNILEEAEQWADYRPF